MQLYSTVQVKLVLCVLSSRKESASYPDANAGPRALTTDWHLAAQVLHVTHAALHPSGSNMLTIHTAAVAASYCAVNNNAANTPNTNPGRHQPVSIACQAPVHLPVGRDPPQDMWMPAKDHSYQPTGSFQGTQGAAT